MKMTTIFFSFLLLSSASADLGQLERTTSAQEDYILEQARCLMKVGRVKCPAKRMYRMKNAYDYSASLNPNRIQRSFRCHYDVKLMSNADQATSEVVQVGLPEGDASARVLRSGLRDVKQLLRESRAKVIDNVGYCYRI